MAFRAIVRDGRRSVALSSLPAPHSLLRGPGAHDARRPIPALLPRGAPPLPPAPEVDCPAPEGNISPALRDRLRDFSAASGALEPWPSVRRSRLREPSPRSPPPLREGRPLPAYRRVLALQTAQPVPCAVRSRRPARRPARALTCRGSGRRRAKGTSLGRTRESTGSRSGGAPVRGEELTL